MSTGLELKRGSNWAKQLQRATRAIDRIEPPPVEGVLTRMIGLTLEAAGCQAAVGDRCEVLGSGGTRVEAEVVGFSGDRLYLMPTGDIHGLKPNARVIPRTGAGTQSSGRS
jgi:flagellum-specific ATP synthase